MSYDEIGEVRLDEGNRKEALAAYEKALAIRKGLAAKDPGNAKWRRDVSVSYDKIGDVRLDEGWQRDLAVSFEHIGNVRSADGKHSAARDAYTKALAIYKKLKAKGVGYPDINRIERLLQAPVAP